MGLACDSDVSHGVSSVTTSPLAFDPTHRRGQILNAALELFDRFGYDAVGIDDLGREVGISGPGIYRHFGSKQEIVVTLIEEVTTGLLERGVELVATEDDPRVGLRRLIEFHTDFALDRGALAGVFIQERRRLPEDASRRVRRVQVAYLEQWAEFICRARPDIDRAIALEAAIAVAALINSRSTHVPRVDRTELRGLLIQLASSAFSGLINEV
ncbi:MAG: AcrR family transcriptional regulator [Candidatus Poriferisodalaceae bacterium]